MKRAWGWLGLDTAQFPCPFVPRPPDPPTPWNKFVMTSFTNVEDTIKRLGSQKGVKGVLVATMDGVPIRTTMDAETAQLYASLATTLSFKARGMVKELSSDDELQVVRVRSRHGEVLIAPATDADKQYCLIVAQSGLAGPLGSGAAHAAE